VLSAEEILIFSVKQTVSKIIAKGSKKKLAHYKQSQLKFKRQNYTDSHSFDGIIFFMSAL
jgi:hypothetical protein